jgi:endonuclease-3 related protein
VEKAILNLKRKNLLSPNALHCLPTERLAEIIRPTGYYNVKSQRIKNFIEFLNNDFKGNLDAFFANDLEKARRLLLGIKGIGFETADSILLYAGEKPSFVVDAYTIRALCRHDIVNDDADYESVRTLFIEHLPHDTILYNEFHALFVRLGKKYCKKTNYICQSCPLAGI